MRPNILGYQNVMAAKIDFILPVYWGCPGTYDSWSFAGLPPMVRAWEELVREGKQPPRVGLFYDTSTLRHNPRGWHVDLSTTAGKQWFYATIRDFFSFVPPKMWAAIEGRPIVVIESSAPVVVGRDIVGFTSRQISSAIIADEALVME